VQLQVAQLLRDPQALAKVLQGVPPPQRDDFVRNLMMLGAGQGADWHRVDAMSFTQHRGPPPPTGDEMRLRQIEALIADTKQWRREEAARKAAEAAARAERERATGGYTLDDLERMRAELVAQIAEREAHLRADTERLLMHRRAEHLSAEIEIGETKLQDLRAQRDALMAKR
jgi:hypothetical protein